MLIFTARYMRDREWAGNSVSFRNSVIIQAGEWRRNLEFQKNNVERRELLIARMKM